MPRCAWKNLTFALLCLQTTIADANHRGFWAYTGLQSCALLWGCWIALVPTWRCLPRYTPDQYVSPLNPQPPQAGKRLAAVQGMIYQIMIACQGWCSYRAALGIPRADVQACCTHSTKGVRGKHFTPPRHYLGPAPPCACPGSCIPAPDPPSAAERLTAVVQDVCWKQQPLQTAMLAGAAAGLAGGANLFISLFGFHTFLVAKGQTTWELLRGPYVPYLAPYFASYENRLPPAMLRMSPIYKGILRYALKCPPPAPFDQGAARNFMVFLFARKPYMYEARYPPDVPLRESV